MQRLEVEDARQRASQLEGTGTRIGNGLSSLHAGLGKVVSALQGLALPELPEAHGSEDQQRTATMAAAIIDAVVPVVDAELDGQVLPHQCATICMLLLYCSERLQYKCEVFTAKQRGAVVRK